MKPLLKSFIVQARHGHKYFPVVVSDSYPIEARNQREAVEMFHVITKKAYDNKHFAVNVSLRNA